MDKFTTNDRYVRDIITRSLLSEGYEVTITPKFNGMNMPPSEELTVYRIERIALDDKKPGRSY